MGRDLALHCGGLQVTDMGDIDHENNIRVSLFHKKHSCRRSHLHFHGD